MLQKMKETEMVGSLTGTQPISFKHIPSDTAALSTHCNCICIQHRADDSQRLPSDNVFNKSDERSGDQVQCWPSN